MRNILLGTAAIALAMSGPALAGDGKDKGHGGGHGKAHAGASAKPGGERKGDGDARARVAARAEARADRRDDRRDMRADRRDDRREARAERREDSRDDRREYRADRRDDRRDAREDYRDDRKRDVRVVRGDRRDDRDWSWVRSDRQRDLIVGCPPGLAKKGNGCIPPGLAKKANWRNDRDWDRGWYGYRYRPALFGLNRYDDGRFFYDDGYLLRIGDSGRISGYIPLLGGALAIGNVWPVSYSSYEVPRYYSDYYNLGAPNAYRYADNVIYRVDPEDAAIMSVAALLTGDEFAIGQRMPMGYDVYNVPYAYRDRYYDTPDAMYRYSDGYVYRVDPKTMLVAAAIDLVV